MLIGACVVLRWLFVGYVGKRVVSGGLIRRASVGVDLRDVWPPALQREGKLAFCLNYSLMAFSGQDYERRFGYEEYFSFFEVFFVMCVCVCVCLCV
jgi:hypothetical protein